MNEQQTNQQSDQHTAGERVHERCVCNQVFEHLKDTLGISPSVRQHLANSRIEFLKAIREVIDERIERLSTKGQQGTKITIE